MDLSMKVLPSTIEVISLEEQSYPHLRDVKSTIEDVSGILKILMVPSWKIIECVLSRPFFSGSGY
jgi:hypothetical protein